MMLIIALVLAVIGLAALVTAVVTSNELIAWVCIGASVIGVVLLIVDALRERSRAASGSGTDEIAGESDETTESEESDAVDYPEEAPETEDITASDVQDQREEADDVVDEGAEEPKN